MNNSTLKYNMNGSPSLFQGQTCETWPEYFDIIIHVESFAIIIANTLLALIIVKQKELYKKHSSKLFLSLQVTHIAFATTQIAFTHVSWDKYALSISNSLLFQMFLTLVIKTVDRWALIQYPYWYETITKKKILFVLFASWIGSGTFFSVCVVVGMHQKMLMIISSCLIVISTIILGVCNTSIYLIVQYHRKVIKKTNLNFQPEQQNHRKRKSPYSCFALVISFIILWSPYLIHNIVSLSGVFLAASCHTASQSVIGIAQINSLLDPLLYSLFNRDVKKAVKRLLLSRREDENNTEERNNDISNNVSSVLINSSV